MKAKRKKYLITGTSKGIGKSIALKLLKFDYEIIGISRSHSIKSPNYKPFFLLKPHNAL